MIEITADAGYYLDLEVYPVTEEEVEKYKNLLPYSYSRNRNPAHARFNYEIYIPDHMWRLIFKPREDEIMNLDFDGSQILDICVKCENDPNELAFYTMRAEHEATQ